MYSAETWAREFESVVAAIPRADGENEDQKKARVARVAGISRATLFNILAGKQTRLMGVDGWLRLLRMVPEKYAGVRADHVQNILQALALKLERGAP